MKLVLVLVFVSQQILAFPSTELTTGFDRTNTVETSTNSLELQSENDATSQISLETSTEKPTGNAEILQNSTANTVTTVSSLATDQSTEKQESSTSENVKKDENDLDATTVDNVTSEGTTSVNTTENTEILQKSTENTVTSASILVNEQQTSKNLEKTTSQHVKKDENNDLEATTVGNATSQVENSTIEDENTTVTSANPSTTVTSTVTTLTTENPTSSTTDGFHVTDDDFVVNTQKNDDIIEEVSTNRSEESTTTESDPVVTKPEKTDLSNTDPNLYQLESSTAYKIDSSSTIQTTESSTIQNNHESTNETSVTTTESIRVAKSHQEFYDDWDYKNVGRGQMPILRMVGENHRMPPNFNDTIRMILEMQQNQNRIVRQRNVTDEKQMSSIFSKVTCSSSCNSTISFLKLLVKTNKSETTIQKTVKNSCISVKLLSATECEGFANLFLPDIIYVLRHTNISAGEFCSFLSGQNCGFNYDQSHTWKIPIPSRQKHVELTKKPLENVPTFKVLHLSDTHYDPDYLEGSNAECGLPLCCQAQNGPPVSKEKAAGTWGDYRKCDLPKRTLLKMLEHINQTHPDIDYILWTGDTTPHDIWNQTRENNLYILNETFRMIYEYFPKTPIFPAIGNHEAAPVNNFAPPFITDTQFSISWLYDEVEQIWAHWLPETSSKTVKHGAFYSVLLRTGFRIISINTNYCNNQNIWLVLNSTDVAHELQWLTNELQVAESNNESVHIIGHIPPGGDDCGSMWFQNYREIIKRFQSTIAAQFFAHTHADEFKIFYEDDSLQNAMSVAFIGPSATPYYNFNPGYRLYYVDGDHEQTTRTVIDYETWVLDLQAANAHNRLHWMKLYSAKLAYGMESLQPEDWQLLHHRLESNHEMFDLFYKFYYKGSPARPEYSQRAKQKILCELQGQRLHANQTVCH